MRWQPQNPRECAKECSEKLFRSHEMEIKYGLGDEFPGQPPFAEGYENALNDVVLERILMLVLLLDRAQNHKAHPKAPKLFNSHPRRSTSAREPPHARRVVDELQPHRRVRRGEAARVRRQRRRRRPPRRPGPPWGCPRRASGPPRPPPRRRRRHSGQTWQPRELLERPAGARDLGREARRRVRIQQFRDDLARARVVRERLHLQDPGSEVLRAREAAYGRGGGVLLGT